MIIFLTLISIHIQRKLSLVFVSKIVDLLWQQRLVAHTHVINFIITFTSLYLRIIVCCIDISYFGCCNLWTVYISLTILTEKTKFRWRFIVKNLFNNFAYVESQIECIFLNSFPLIIFCIQIKIISHK